MDGVTWYEYETGLEERLADLHSRVHRGAYRAQPSRRKYIEKSDGRQRPLAIAALEDKVVQQASDGSRNPESSTRIPINVWSLLTQGGAARSRDSTLGPLTPDPSPARGEGRSD